MFLRHYASMMRDRDVFTQRLAAALEGWGLTITQAQLDRLARHFELMVEANQRVNLTRITGPQEAALKHYADSLALLLWPEVQPDAPVTLLDVGTGAGFPAVPLAVMRPEWRITAIDSTRKKTAFVDHAAQELGLAQFEVVHARAEHWHPQRKFQVLTLRAVAEVKTALEKTAHLVAPKGYVVLYKTKAGAEREISAAQAWAKRMRLVPAEEVEYTLAADLQPRRLVIYRKQ